MVITGGAAGLGLAASKAFAAKGATVVIADWNKTSGAAAAQSIPNGKFVWIDLSSFASIRAFLPALETVVGPSEVSILINNAAGPGDTQQTTADGFVLQFEIDYLGPFLLTELLLPSLRAAAKKTGKRSKVVNIASAVHEHACELGGWDKECFKDFTYLPLPSLPPKKVVVHYDTVTMNETTTYVLRAACWDRSLNFESSTRDSKPDRDTSVFSCVRARARSLSRVGREVAALLPLPTCSRENAPTHLTWCLSFTMCLACQLSL